jgi:acetylornithine deacetylase/succinyl-diaminopimelate desuccinylase-like protein
METVMADAGREAIVRDICAIAAISAPTFAEEPRLEWLSARLGGMPGALERDAVGNLIWSWGEGPPGLLLTAHVDTVFPATIPLTVDTRDGWLVGAGVGDNAAAVAVAVAVVGRFLRAGRARAGAVAFTVQEEGLGNLAGARGACAALRPEAVIALEGHGLESVVADAHGSIRARISVAGPGGHAWADRGRLSAIHELLRMGAELLDHGSPDAPVNIGLIRGGLAINAIASSAELTVEKRADDAGELGGFHAVLEGLATEPPLELGVEILGERPAGALERDHPLLATVLDVRRALGLELALESGSTDANAAVGLGIPAIGLGVSRGRDMHTVEEAIEISSLDLGARQLELILDAMLREPG